MKKLLLLYAICLLAWGTPSALAEIITAGKTSISIDTPVGYKKFTAESNPEEYYVESQFFPIYEILIFYRKIENQENKHFIVVSIDPKIKNENFSNAEFEAIKPEVIKTFKDIDEVIPNRQNVVDSVSSKIAKAYEGNYEFKPALTFFISKFIDTPHILSFLLFHKGSHKIEKTTIPYKRVSSVNLILVKNKILMVQIIRDFQEESNIEELKRFTKDFTYHLVVSNALKGNQ